MKKPTKNRRAQGNGLIAVYMEPYRNNDISKLLKRKGYKTHTFADAPTTIRFLGEVSTPKELPFVLVTRLGDGKENSGKELVQKMREASKETFIVVFSKTATENPKTRLYMFDYGANMVTDDITSLEFTLDELSKTHNTGGKCECPFCGMKGLTSDALYWHYPLHHIYDQNIHSNCPVCGKFTHNLACHIHYKHAPKEVTPEPGGKPLLYAFALAVVRRESDGKFLVCQEFANQGYWLPGGAVDPGETFEEAAKRECIEEAGVEIELIRLLEMQYSPMDGEYARMRVIYLAKPVDESKPLKTHPDFESAGACWVSVGDIDKLPLRGPEPSRWFKHVASGGDDYPLSLVVYHE